MACSERHFWAQTHRRSVTRDAAFDSHALNSRLCRNHREWHAPRCCSDGPESPHNAGTQFHYAATEKLLDTSATYHIGLRGTTTVANGFPRTRALGYDKLITMNEVMRRGIDDVLLELQTQLKGRPIYLCLDMDVFDPSCAPGVCAPSWCGFTAREGMAICADSTA